MKIRKTIRTFSKIKAAILSDGKIDAQEAEKLHAFVGKYVKSGNAKYADFERVLNKYLEDGVITDEESAKIISLMDDMTEFLKIELGVKCLAIALLAVVLVLGTVHFACS